MRCLFQVQNPVNTGLNRSVFDLWPHELGPKSKIAVDVWHNTADSAIWYLLVHARDHIQPRLAARASATRPCTKAMAWRTSLCSIAQLDLCTLQRVFAKGNTESDTLSPFLYTLAFTYLHIVSCLPGDGRAVAIPSQGPPPIYDVPRSLLDTTLPPSYKYHNSIPGYNNDVLSRSRSPDHDSGYRPSPTSSMSTPTQLDGPPVPDKHSLICWKSGPCDMSHSNSTTSFGSLSEHDLHYNTGGSPI